MEVSIYEMMINNVAYYIMSEENSAERCAASGVPRMTAFIASDVIAAALCIADKEKIVLDIVKSYKK